jgi:hypothetical protein
MASAGVGEALAFPALGGCDCEPFWLGGGGREATRLLYALFPSGALIQFCWAALICSATARRRAAMGLLTNLSGEN